MLYADAIQCDNEHAVCEFVCSQRNEECDVFARALRSTVIRCRCRCRRKFARQVRIEHERTTHTDRTQTMNAPPPLRVERLELGRICRRAYERMSKLAAAVAAVVAVCSISKMLRAPRGAASSRRCLTSFRDQRTIENTHAFVYAMY